MRRILLILLALNLYWLLHAQATYEYISNKNIYNLLDELASEKIIDLNPAIKPYTRSYIYKKLLEAGSVLEDSIPRHVSASTRLIKELNHYLDYYRFGNDFNTLPGKDKLNMFRNSPHSSTSLNHFGFFYSDSVFNFSLRPVIGLEYYSNSSGTYKHTYGGLEAFASITKYLSFYASLRDNTVDPVLSRPAYFSTEPAGNYKGSLTGAADFSEMRGGIMLSWDFLEVGFVKDHINWGTNYNGAIIQSGLTPSMPMLKLHIKPAKWFDFNYFHAWLVSDVIDSSLTYLFPNGSRRDTYKNKFLAANMFTITPVKGLKVSIGNSIIYSDQSVNLAYLIPVFFYKSVDHTMTSYKIANQNSQMFFDISSRLIRHTHLFFSMYVDEFSTTRISDPDRQNLYSYKLGGRISNWPFSNVSFTGEYFRSMPGTYEHYGPTLTYETNSYNMGYWLRYNSDEKYFALEWRPVQRLFTRYSYDHARHYNDNRYDIKSPVDELPVLEDKTWSNVTHSIQASYEVFTGCYVSAEYRMSNIQGYEADGQTADYYLNTFTPEFFRGKRNTFMFRVALGF